MAQASLSTRSRNAPSRRAAEQAGGSDLWLLTAVVALTLLGLVVVYSATYALSYMNFEGPRTWYLNRQLLWAGLGVAMLALTWWLDYRVWKKLSIWLMFGIIGVLAAMFVIGQTSFGATRWLLAGGSVQPSEAAKLITIIYVAHWASSKGDRLRTLEAGLVPFGLMIGTVCGLILMQPSFSTALLVGAVATTMFFIAGADLKQLAITGGAAGGVLYFIARSAAYRMERIVTWQDPWAAEMGGGFQTVQVLYALARGGLFGQGLGTTKDRMLDVPAAHTDAIFAILAQEMGLVTCLIVLGLYLLLAYRGYRIAANAQDGFGAVLAIGLTCWLTYQALFNIAVITNTLPNTGIPLPFLSFGGSGLVVALTGVGILLSISRRSGRAGGRR